MELFKDFGLLIVDSGDNNLRRLERELFIKQIHLWEQLSQSVIKQQEELAKLGFNRTISINTQSVNFFYYDNQERVLLEFDKERQLFVGKNGVHHFNTDSMLELARNHPEKLSTNVVARPLAQEYLFPTLAFIAGPGEIAYWAELQKAFELFNLKMPPVVPRLNITILDRSIETNMKELELDLYEVLSSGTQMKQAEFLESVKDTTLEHLFEETKRDLRDKYKNIEQRLITLDRGLLPLLQKNEQIIQSQIDFMSKKIEASLKEQHNVILKKFEQVENALKPLGSPQERILTGYFYINKYDFDFIRDLTKLPYQFDGKHKVVIV
ncbi:bacillithiol biosynthesis cysteine-adding enzyme BshC [Bacillus aquiflavi]|uniref:bacillithiol biosynthesis cysteine-adding enzyme BshC n=1 Tax=Bacillus aquiflavi TaxID=2672567 RepID=UPI00223B3694|nr:bacillithiol biosynthesis cysteine-adding enzyme BshC [Bacillus aquiflavi]